MLRFPRSVPIALLLTLLAALAPAETLLTEAQALKLVFPKSQSVETENRSLTDAQREQLQKTTGLRFPEPQYKCFVGKSNGKPDGYAVIMNEIGKHEFITFIVGVDPKGQVSDVGVMEFREARGGEVKEQRFLRQFHGKRQGDPITVNRDIVNYTGATLSSHAIAHGVKKALALVNLFYREGQK
jgi:Na+-translocating ferredoxin:NAD+ oxidoreductase RnfG subunit